MSSQRQRKRLKDKRSRAQTRLLFPLQLSASRGFLRRVRETRSVAGSFDWRAKIDFVARHQGQCESCTAFAVAAAIEIQSAIEGRPVLVSPGYLHTCLGNAGKTDPEDICRAGVDLWQMLKLARDKGCLVGESHAYPYPATLCDTVQPSLRIKSFPPIASSDQMKAALRQGPVVADMFVDRSFFSWQGALYRSSTSDGSLHTVCLIGYNAEGWIVLNSLGPRWGDGTGCVTVPYESCGLLDQQKSQAYSISL